MVRSLPNLLDNSWLIIENEQFYNEHIFDICMWFLPPFLCFFYPVSLFFSKFWRQQTQSPLPLFFLPSLFSLFIYSLLSSSIYFAILCYCKSFLLESNPKSKLALLLELRILYQLNTILLLLQLWIKEWHIQEHASISNADNEQKGFLKNMDH